MKRVRTKTPSIPEEHPLMHYEDKEETSPLIMQATVQKGVSDTELSIFSNCSFLKERLENLSSVVLMLEKDLCNKSIYDGMSPDQKLKLYTTYSAISMQMLEFLKDVHGLIADEVKFKRIQDLIMEAKGSLNKESPTVMSPKMRQVLEAVRDVIGRR